jgi:transketolase
MSASHAVRTDLDLLARDLRRTILVQSHRAHVGHIGSALSIADIVAALYGGVIGVQKLSEPDRDRFVLSKGHAALALYAALFSLGLIDQETLDSYCGDGSRLGVHPERQAVGIDFSTGSLGHGLSLGAGAALGGRLRRSARRVFVVASDAECNEGATWEAVMFAAHHELSNLVVIVDVNGQQALGKTRDVLDLEPLDDRWAAFGWDVHRVDGHDRAAIVRTINQLDFRAGPPHVLLADTTFGKGVPFMESRVKWHYMPMSDDEFEQALSGLEGVG